MNWLNINWGRVDKDFWGKWVFSSGQKGWIKQDGQGGWLSCLE